MPQIHRAAYNLDLKTVIQLLAATPLAPTPNTHTVAHALLHGMHSIKAGDISRTLGWTDVRRTLLRHEYVLALEPEVRPVLAEVLRREPRQATHVDAGGHSLLHVAALVGAVGFIDELLRAGAPGAAQRRRAHADRRGGAVGQHRGARDAPRGVPGRARGAPARLAEWAALPGAHQPARAGGALGSGGGSGGDGRRPVDEGEQPRNGAAGAAPTCAEGGGWDAEAPPTAAARAAASTGASITADELLNEYFLKGRPVMLRGAMSLAERCEFARDAPAAAGLFSQPVQCGRTAYPNLTGQRFCGAYTIKDLNSHPQCTDALKTLPICVKKPGGPVNATAGWQRLPARFRMEDDNPPHPALSKLWTRRGSRQLFAGGKGSGAAFHFHGAAYNVLFFGTKHWVLTPPRYAGITGEASTEWRTTIKPKMPEGLPVTCVQGPGDMMVVPPQWGHATINHGFNIGVGDLFCDVRMSNFTSGSSRGGSNRQCDGLANQQTRSSYMRDLIANGKTGAAWLRGNPPPPKEETPAAPAAAAAPPLRRAPEVAARRPAPRRCRSRPARGGHARARPGWRQARGRVRDGGDGGGADQAPRQRARRRRSLPSIDGAAASGWAAAQMARRPQPGASARGRMLGGRAGAAGRGRRRRPEALPFAPGEAAASTAAARGGAAPLSARARAPTTARWGRPHQQGGGTAIINLLQKYCRPQLLWALHPPALQKLRALRSRLVHASAALQQWAVGASAWKQAYTFALVRNPWARQVSMFHFLLQEASCTRPVGQRPDHCDKRLPPQAGPWLRDFGAARARFQRWLLDMGAAFLPGHKEQHLFGARFHGNERDAWYNASQISWSSTRRARCSSTTSSSSRSSRRTGRRSSRRSARCAACRTPTTATARTRRRTPTTRGTTTTARAPSSRSTWAPTSRGSGTRSRASRRRRSRIA